MDIGLSISLDLNSEHKTQSILAVSKLLENGLKDMSLHLGAARKALMLSKIAIFRVAKTTTLKMPKVVIISDLRGAPGAQHW